MSQTFNPAPSVRKIRAIIIIAILISIVAGAFIVPAMGDSGQCEVTCGHCAEQYGEGTPLYWICRIFGGDCVDSCAGPWGETGSPL